MEEHFPRHDPNYAACVDQRSKASGAYMQGAARVCLQELAALIAIHGKAAEVQGKQLSS
jgi:hypothetical protein